MLLDQHGYCYKMTYATDAKQLIAKMLNIDNIRDEFDLSLECN